MTKLIDRLIARWQESLIGRVLQRFNDSHGAVLASGMSFSAVFSVFAALWIGIGVFGFLLTGNPELWDTIMALLNSWIPGLIDLGNGGAIDPGTLRPSISALSWTGAIALLALLFTALGWLEATRSSLYAVMGLPESKRNVVVVKVTDIGLMLGFGIIILLTGVSAIAAGSAASWLSDLTHFGEQHEMFSTGVIQIAGFSVNFVFNIVVLLMLFRVLARVKLRVREYWLQLLCGAIALTIMQALGSILLGGASRNPLLATFAILVGLLLWFNLVSRLILLIAAWIAVSHEPELEMD
ncbi:MAG: YihY/virulence factor BrkB family protein [Microbacteriaceae bacterium]